MAKVLHQAADYHKVRKELTYKQDEFFHEWIVATSALAKTGGERFTIQEIAVLLFILGRTLLFRKKAEMITIKHFLEGVKDQHGERVCGPCGLKERVLRDVLRGLLDGNVLTAHCFLEGRAETSARIYEVHTANLVGNSRVEEVVNMTKRGGLPPSKSCHTPWQNLPHITSLLRRDISSTDVEESAAPQPSNSRGGLKEAKKPRVAVNCNSKGAATLAQVQARHAQNRATRIAANAVVPKKRWTTPELQALLDEARDRATAETNVKCPRVVVSVKLLSVLHKRMLAADLGSPIDFFSWVFANWGRIAQANRRSKAKQMREKQKESSAMSASPNFSDLALRCPYFFPFYNDRVHEEETTAQQKKEELQKENDRHAAQAEAMAARRELARLRDEEAERQRAAPVRRRTRTVARDDDDDEIPEYKERVWRA